MFQRLDECPICNHPKFTNFQICTDHLLTQESFALVKCEKCSHVFTNPRPNTENLQQYYESNQYDSHHLGFSPLALVYRTVRSLSVRRKQNLIRKYADKGTLLDYGCGTGYFLGYMRKKGWDTIGLEPDTQARKLAGQTTGCRVFQSLEEIDQGLDVITAWHVIEHVPDPVETLRQLRKRLNPSGVLVVAVPNYLSFDARHYREKWAGYDVPRHLSHFSQASMAELAKRTKLQVLATYPLFFDSYYVSLLSERNQGNGNPIMRAMKIGKQSNDSAKNTGEYSSLIYILAR